MRLPRTLQTATAAAVAAGTLAVAAVSASAAPAPVSEHYAGRAGAQVVELSLLGRTATFGSAVTDSNLEAVGRQLAATATGTGTDLSPGTRSVARFSDSQAAGGTRCAGVPLTTGLSASQAKPATTASRSVPGIDMSPACGTATVTGTADGFKAESVGGATRITVKLPAALQSLVAKATGQLAPQTLATPVGDLVRPDAPATAEVTRAVGTLNGVLGRIVPGVALPAMEPHQTVKVLLDRLQGGDLLHIDLATATARNAADPGAYVAEALSQGGVIDVLPGFRGPDSAPLLRMAISRSRAAVPVERASTKTTPAVENAVVRIESDVLASLPVAGPPVVNGLVHGVALSGVPGGGLPVAGGLLGGGLPLDRVVSGLGLRSGAGYVEVGPGQSLSVLCDGAVAPLCSEVSVGAAKAPVTLPDGATRAESSTVTVHLFKGLDSLAPGTNLGTALAQPAVTRALTAALPAGATIGDASGISGIRLVSGGAVAEAGGSRVLGTETVRTPAAVPPAPTPAAVPAPVKDLPHTGGQPFSPAMAPALLACGLGLGGLARRRRPVQA
jgi:hypothetical protein